MSNTQAPPEAEPDNLNRLFRISGSILVGFAIAAAIVYLVGSSLSDSILVDWCFRLLAIFLVGLGLTAASLRIKPVYLSGEADQWHVLLGWDDRIIGFLPSGPARIKPIQKVKRWMRVHPLIIKHDMQAYTGSRDLFDVHVRVLLNINPRPAHGPDARWLYDFYKDNLAAMIRSTLEDLVVREMRSIRSFTQAVDERTAETTIQTAVNTHYLFLEPKGVFIAADQTFVDVMVPKEVLQKRIRTRADLTELQVIRDVAHELGIPLNELLIQQVLGRLTGPQRTAGLARKDVIAALELLAGRQQLDRRSEPVGVIEPESLPPPDEAGPVDTSDENSSADADDTTPPASYIEGTYRYTGEQHPNDPDADTGGPTKYVSPF